MQPQEEQLNIKNNKYRTKEHQAILKLKATEQHIDMMKRRCKLLQVKDEINRSKTIQHQRIISAHEHYKEQKKKEQSILNKVQNRRLQQIQKMKDKNLNLKSTIEESIRTAREKIILEKEEDFHSGRQSQQKNQEIVMKLKEQDLKEKQERKRLINEKQQIQKNNVNRYRESRIKDTLEQKKQVSNNFAYLTMKKQKELENLSRMEEQMIKRSSQSLQASQVVRNRLKQVIGDDRRFTKLPQIRNKSTRGSTGNTQIISL